jgi:hypothetical protein
MTIPQVITASASAEKARGATTAKPDTATLRPITAAVLRSAVESDDLDDLIAVGLAIHLFTEIVGGHVALSVTDLHRATTVLTKQVIDALTQHSDDALRTVLRLVTDGERESLPDGRRACELCGEAWPAVRTKAYSRAEQSIRGAHDYGVEPMLRLAATRAVVESAPWWGTPRWRERLHAFMAANTTGALEHFTLGTAPEYASEASLLAIVA